MRVKARDHNMPLYRLAAVIAVAAVFIGAGKRPLQVSPSAAPPAPVQHVVIISIDGLRPDLLDRGDTPAIHGLMRAGSYTLQARTVDEVYTLPSHTSMLTGVVPSRHGVTWDNH